jgi:hypothetical protein
LYLLSKVSAGLGVLQPLHRQGRQGRKGRQNQGLTGGERNQKPETHRGDAEEEQNQPQRNAGQPATKTPLPQSSGATTKTLTTEATEEHGGKQNQKLLAETTLKIFVA